MHVIVCLSQPTRCTRADPPGNYILWEIIITTNGRLWWGTLKIREAVRVRRQRVYEKSWYPLLSVAVNLKRL